MKSFFLFSVYCCLLMTGGLVAQAKQTGLQEPPALQIKQLIEGDLGSGQSQTYQIQLKAGEFLNLEVTERNIDVLVTLSAPDGKSLIEMDSKGGRLWRETLSCVAEVSGSYRLLVHASDQAAYTGKYSIRIVEERVAMQRDQKRLLAEKALSEGRRLFEQGDASLPLAADKFQQAILLWRQLGEKYWEAVTLTNLGWIYTSQSKSDEAIAAHTSALSVYREMKDRTGEGRALNGLGNVYSALRSYEKAVDYYSQALSARRETQDLSGESNTLFQMASIYYQRAQYEKAGEYYEQSLKIKRELKDRAGEGSALYSLGVTYDQLKQYQRAFDYYRSSLAVKQELKQRRDEADLLSSLGTDCYYLGQHEQARDYYDRALAIYRELKTPEGEGNALYNLGLAYDRLKQLEQARDYFQRSLAIRHELKDRKDESLSLSALASDYYFLGQLEKARDCYERALSIYRELKDLTAESNSMRGLGTVSLQQGQYEKARDYYLQALALDREGKDRDGEGASLYSLGIVDSHLSQFESARKYYQQALDINREVKNRAAESGSLVGLGDVYFSLSQFAKARDSYEQALVIARELKDRRREGNPLGGLGNVYIQLKQYEKARDYRQQALIIWREVKDRGQEGSLLIDLGQTCQFLGQYEQARAYIEQGLVIVREVKDHSREGGALHNLGNISFLMGDYEKSRDYFEQSLAISRELKTSVEASSTLNNLMIVWLKLSNPRVAIFYGKQAVNTLQGVRGNIRHLEKESQRSFLQANEQIYRTLANVLIETGRLPEAEQVLALLKDEEYSGLLRRGSEPTSDVGYSPAEAETAKLQTELAEIARERSSLLALRNQNGLDEKGRQRLDQIERDLIPKANAQLRLALENINKEAPGSTAKTTEIKEAQSLMRYLRELGPGTVALYTVISTDKERIDKGWIILVTPDFRKAYSIDVKDLGQTIAGFRQALSSPVYDPQPLGQKLYQMLFLNPQANGPTLAADLQTYLRDQKDRTLMWSLDGILRYVPMAALYDGDKYLVERYRNVVFTTASLAGLTQPVSRDWKALGLGVSKQYPGFAALSGASRELAAVVRDPANKSAGSGVLPGTTKLDDQFTEKTMMDSLREGFTVVHIASHFSYQPANPAASFLLLGDGSHLETAKFEDSANIFDKTELLTLSACDTANGSDAKDANGKDAEGLAYVSQKLGAQSVIASLWPVDDIGTQVLMPLFYRLRMTGLSKAEAFQRAQLALLHGEVKEAPGVTRSSQVVSDAKSGPRLNAYTTDPQRPFAHPYFWAPFVLIGNWK